jgi:hypothetical protein
MKTLISFVLFVMSMSVAFSQTLTDKQIKDSIVSAYMDMNEFHLSVNTKATLDGQEPVSFTYELYKKQNEFYIKYINMEVIFNTSIVLMVVPDQKALVIRQITDEESKKIKEIAVPKISDASDTIIYKFFETQKYYVSSAFNPTHDIAEMKFYYNKTTFLLDKVESIHYDTDEQKNQKTLITYTYSKLPKGINYFNSDKYIIKTAKGYITTAAYSSYSISLNNPYEN